MEILLVSVICLLIYHTILEIQSMRRRNRLFEMSNSKIRDCRFFSRLLLFRPRPYIACVAWRFCRARRASGEAARSARGAPFNEGQALLYYYLTRPTKTAILRRLVRTQPDIFESAIYLFIYFFFFLYGSKNFHVYTYPHSLSVRQLMCKTIFGLSENFIANRLQ